MGYKENLFKSSLEDICILYRPSNDVCINIKKVNNRNFFLSLSLTFKNECRKINANKILHTRKLLCLIRTFYTNFLTT